MKKGFYIYLATACVLLSCSSPKALEYRTYHNFSIQKLGFTETTISLDLEYFNPNSFGMKLKNTDLDIFVNGNLLGHSVTDSLISIPKKGTFLVPVKFNVDMKNAFKNAWNTLTGKDVLIRLSGKVKVGKGNVFMSFPVEYESRQAFTFF